MTGQQLYVRETNTHKPSWTSSGPWLLPFQVQCIRCHTTLPAPMGASVPSKLWIPVGESEPARPYNIFWEKPPPHLAENKSLSLIPDHLPKACVVQWGVCVKGCGRMGQGREPSSPLTGTHQEHQVNCVCSDLIFCHHSIRQEWFSPAVALSPL